MKLVMGRAGAGTPSANRITLLRDADGDGVAETSAPCSSKGLNSPFGMALVGDDLYVANTDADHALSLPGRRHADHRSPARKLADLPAGPDQPPLDQEPDRQPRRHASSTSTVGSNSNVGENGMEAEDEPRRDLGGRSRHRRARASSPRGLRNPNGLAWEPRQRRAVGRGQRARRDSAATSCPTT